MKRTSIILISALAAAAAGAQASSWSNYDSFIVPADRSLVYSLSDEG